MIDAAAAGQVLVWIGTAAVGAWGIWQKILKDRAATATTVAESKAEQSVADAQQIVYTTLTNRLTALETEMQSVRNELAVERQHSRNLEKHIWKLEGVMRQAGVPVPAFDTGSL